jgi:hypothetical protein
MSILDYDKANALAEAARRGDLNALGIMLRDVAAVLNPGDRIVNITGATASILPALHDGKTLTINRAAGVTVTLPPATGSGLSVRFVVGTTITSNNLIIQVTGDDIMTGACWMAQDGGDTCVAFETAADSDTITMNGTTKGGIKGDIIELQDIAADTWSVRIHASGTSSEATPFSAAVS